MDNAPNRRSYLKFVVVSAVVLVGIAYFASGPFRSKVDRRIQQATQWTPENIQKDPEGYLFQAKQKVKDAQAKLEANLIDVAQHQGSVQNLLIERVAKRDAVSELLTEMRAAYIDSRDNDNWPAKVGDRFIAEPLLRKQIIEAHSRFETLKSQSVQLQSLIAQLNEREQQTRDQMSDLETTSKKIDSDLEIVKATQVMKDFKAIKINMEAISTVGNIVTAVPTEGSLDAMIAEHRSAATDDKFEAILNGDK